MGGVFAGQPENVPTWNALNQSAAQVLTDRHQNGGNSASEQPLAGVAMVNANAASDTPWSYTAEQTDVAGNVSPKGKLSVLVDTTPPPLLDMDIATEGMQAASTRLGLASELRLGVAFAPSVAPPTKTTASAIDVVFSGAGLDLSNDRLLLDALVALDANLVPVSGKTVGGVADISYVYTTATRTLSINKTRGGTFTAAEVEAIVESIKLQNLSPSVGTRIITISLRDDAGLVGPSMQATLSVSSDGLMLDLDPATAGLQTSSTQYVTDLARMAAGVPFDTAVGVPTSTQISAIRVTLGGAGFIPGNDRLLLDTTLNLDRNQAAADGKTVGGVSGLNYGYDSASRTLTVRKTSGAVLTGAEVQAIVQAIKLAGAELQDGTRTARFSLVGSSGEVAAASTASLVVDTQPPTLDTDPGRNGVQRISRKLFSAAEIVAGDGLFAGDFALWPASGISTIAVRMSGAQLDLARDKLVLDAPIALNTGLATTDGKIVGGVGGLSYGYDSGNQTLTIRKSSGAILNDLEARAILKAVQLQNSTPTGGDRIATVTLSDKAGNSSATSLSMGVDLTVPAAIGAVLVPSVQTSYRTFAVPDILGATNRHNLSPGESADLTGLLNFGMDARAFLPTIRAISMDWGGSNITGDANTTSSSLRSVVSFAGINSGDIFLMGSQGGSGVRSGNFSLSIPSPGKLSLNASGTFTTPGADLFENKPRGPSASFDVGNIQFLYQVTTNNPSSMPTINISYDGRQASTGDMLALYEGSKLLGSRILTDGDVGRANVTLGVTVEASLAAGDHVITPKFIDMAGNTVNARDITFTSVPGTVLPTLSNLRVSGESGVAQALNDSPTQYAVITELPTNANGLPPPEQNLTFSGTVGKAGSGDNYAITVVMGNRIMAFGQFAAGDFSLSAPANILAPGLYRDVAIAATNITDGINNGQITRTKDQLLGWYWLPQNLQNINGGAGDDVIPLGVTAGGVDTIIQTGAGKDTLVVGAYGNPNTSRLAATVTDFFLGQEKVSIFGQTVTRANLDSYVTASSFKGTSTKLVIDLDGAGPGTTTYSLYLQNLPYHPNNVPTIFGV
ncbi:MAG TPA: hypothetical protein VE092_22055 [Herbaspirillum sp.]|uniref:hypothetical protein n=1 Tax=Herbaspirillum sp. TaxID=1890675 RepID=UPI002D45B47D|nr:hypothetical protein [Herbaspirillum sp.]HZG22703.1 hypothetical protein [Herbaspirillum sp.]